MIVALIIPVLKVVEEGVVVVGVVVRVDPTVDGGGVELCDDAPPQVQMCEEVASSVERDKVSYIISGIISNVTVGDVPSVNSGSYEFVHDASPTLTMITERKDKPG